MGGAARAYSVPQSFYPLAVKEMGCSPAPYPFPGRDTTGTDQSPERLPRRRRVPQPSCANGAPILCCCRQPFVETAERLLCFICVHPALWKAVGATNAIEQLNREFRRCIKKRILLPCAHIVPVRFRVLTAPT